MHQIHLSMIMYYIVCQPNELLLIKAIRTETILKIMSKGTVIV
jgi:hypothetical protein